MIPHARFRFSHTHTQNDYASSGYEPPELELTEPMLSDPDVGLDDAATWESFPEKNFNDLQVIFRVMMANIVSLLFVSLISRRL